MLATMRRQAEAYQALCKAHPGKTRSFFYAAVALKKSGQPDLAKEMISQGEIAIATNPRAQFDVFLYYDTRLHLC